MKRPLRNQVTVAAIAVAVAATGLGVLASLWVAISDRHALAGASFNAAVVGAFTIVGAVVVGARPANRVGWAMLLGGALWSLGGAGADLAYHGIVAAPGAVPLVATLAVAGSAGRSLGWHTITLAVPAAFPDERLRESPWMFRLLVVIAVAAVLDPLTDAKADLLNLGNWHNPIAPGRPWDLISGLAFLAHVPLGLVATVGVVVLLVRRWRRGDALRRQQITLFALAAALPIVAVPIAFGFGAGGWVFGAAALPLPFTIGFAVLARGLYDLRTAANRTLVWLTLSSVVVAIYALVIVGGVNLLHAPKGARWLPWVAAAAAAIAFAPVRDALQRPLNRLTFGRWDEPYDVLADLGQRLEASADVERLLNEVTRELGTLGLRNVSVCDPAGSVVAGDPVVSPDAAELPLLAYGEAVGALRYEPPPTLLRARDRRLLDDLAGHLGGVLHARRLAHELQEALERQVLAREEERRRLRRDLHDGLGPALAGHLLRLEVITNKVGPESPAAHDVATLRDELAGTVLEVRRVVEGLRPPALDELGLARALAQATERLVSGCGVRLDFDVAELPALPAAIEVAAYRIVTEAVTNVVRHAGATACRVRVGADSGVLRVEVHDDGDGLGPTQDGMNGHGLQTMRERAAELRGRLRVLSGDGTTVVAELPLRPAAGAHTRRAGP